MAAAEGAGYFDLQLETPTRIPPSYTTLDDLEQPSPLRANAHLIVKMANRGYDVVVDVDQEVSQPEVLPSAHLADRVFYRAT